MDPQSNLQHKIDIGGLKKPFLRRAETRPHHDHFSFQHRSDRQSTHGILRPRSTILKSEENAADKIYPCPLPSYQPNKVPADFQKAIDHRIAHRVMKAFVKKSDDRICESTGLVIHNKSLPLGCKRSDLYYLGPVIPMYFLWMKQACFTLAFLALIALIMDLKQSSSMIFQYRMFISELSESQEQVSALVIFTLLVTLLLFFVIHLFRRKQKFTKFACKKSVVTPADYTIMCSNIGRVHTEEEIRKFFTNYIVSEYSLDVVKISITYSIEKYVQEVRKLEDSKDQVAEESNNFFSSQKRKLENYVGLKKNGLVFVTFNTKQEAKTVRRKFELSNLEKCAIQLSHAMTDDYSQYFFKQHFIHVQKAPGLNEIIWENLNCNSSEKIHVILSLVAVFLVLTVTCLGQYAIKSLGYSAVFMGVLIAVSNELLSFLVFRLALTEKLKTITEFYIALGLRTVVAQAINMALPVFLIDIWAFDRRFAEFSQDVFIIGVISSISSLITRAINPEYLIKDHKKKEILKQNDESSLTQSEANHIFEYPEFKFYEGYIISIRTLLYSCLFFVSSPGVGLVGLMILSVEYWIEKYNLLQRSLLPSSMKADIAEAMFEFIDVAVFLLALGCYGFLYIDFRNDNDHPVGVANEVLSYFSFIIMIAAGIYMVLPNNRINRWLFARKRLHMVPWYYNLLYQQVSDYFHEDYSSVNPICKNQEQVKKFPEIFSATKEKFEGSVKILKEVPELLSIFHYASQRPSLYQIWKKGLNGLKDPYFVFPQNYGYGLSFQSYDFLSEASKSFHHNSSPRKSFHLFDLTTEDHQKEDKKNLKRFVSLDNKENEQQRDIELTIFESKPKPELEPSPPNATASIFRDMSVFFPSSSRNINMEDLTNFDPFTPKGTITNLNSELFENGPIESHFSQLNSVSILKSPILQKRSVGPHSPINTMNLLNKKQDSDKTAKTPFFTSQ